MPPTDSGRGDDAGKAWRGRAERAGRVRGGCGKGTRMARAGLWLEKVNRFGFCYGQTAALEALPRLSAGG